MCFILLCDFLCVLCGSNNVAQTQTRDLGLPQEKHLLNVKQLTFGGENAEAYFSPDGKKLIFQSTRDGYGCDLIYTMNVDGSDVRLISTEKGRTTCAYFFPNGNRVLYSSTHLASPQCPPRPDFSKGYVWAIYPSYDIFTARPDGSDLKQLTTTPGYDAETTINRKGELVFTSMRDGDLDIYTMDAKGKNVKRLTNELGYDGGPFWSYDGTQIVYRAYHPLTEHEKAEYLALLKENLIRPNVLEIWVMNADGSNKRQVTHLNRASFAPYFFPDGKRIIFSSNVADPKGRDFDLYMINVDGTGMERITYNNTFDGFPMFSPDGKKLVFASNRNAAKPGETNIFIADWVDSDGKVTGRILNQGGAPVSGATVVFEGGGASQRIESRDDGSFEIQLAPGTYQMKVRKSGFYPTEGKKVKVEPASTVIVDRTLLGIRLERNHL